MPVDAGEATGPGRVVVHDLPRGEANEFEQAMEIVVANMSETQTMIDVQQWLLERGIPPDFPAGAEVVTESLSSFIKEYTRVLSECVCPAHVGTLANTSFERQCLAVDHIAHRYKIPVEITGAFLWNLRRYPDMQALLCKPTYAEHRSRSAGRTHTWLYASLQVASDSTVDLSGQGKKSSKGLPAWDEYF